jgi:hypothetical protein
MLFKKATFSEDVSLDPPEPIAAVEVLVALVPVLHSALLEPTVAAEVPGVLDNFLFCGVSRILSTFSIS